MNDRPPSGQNARRGNALILVSALLVLLTLIAGTFLSRARSQRLNASAMQQRAGLDARGSSLRDQIAGEIAMHLFVRPIDPLAARRVLGGDSAGNRLPPPPESVRYGIESAPPRRDGGQAVGDLLGNDLLPSRAVAGREPGDPRGTRVGSDEFPDGYNFAPYEVRPWTNWPDFRTPVDIASGVTGGRPWWVTNPTATNPATAVVGSVYGNPPGNPGFGDTRWLRSTEPVRVRNRGTLTSPDLIAVPDGAFFSHWTHLSWLPTPDNGFRLVTDVADIESNILAGGMGTTRDGFGTPYEQWLPQLIPTRIPVTATNPSDRDSAWETEFKARRDLWFNPTTYQQTLLDGEYGRMQSLLGSNRMATNRVLPNFIRLDDPLGIGRTHDFDAEPVPASEEYVDGSPRNLVARTFCDADGDGFTDSFWYLLPEGKERNVRTVVGLSVVDNASMVDLNVATRFDRHTTAGFTPADVAVVTAEPEAALLSEREKNRVYPAAPSAIEFGATDTRVGLLDSWWNGVTGDVALLDPFGNPDDGNSNPGIPHAFQRSSVSSTTSSDFGQAFDLYRYAGRPLPMDNDASLPRHDDGQSSLLRSLGVWYGSDEAGYWNPLFHQLPEASAALIGYRERAESLLSLTPAAEDQDRIYAPWFDVWGPGTAARPQRSETRWRRPSGYSSIHLGWDSWLGLLWPGTPRLGPLDGSGGALSINQPFMREEERTRWFQAAMRGEARSFGPLNFGGQVVQATGIGVTGNPADGVRMPLRFFGAADELELRAYAGNNDAAVMSRLESSLNGDNLGRSLPGGSYRNLDTVLRSSILRAEGGISGNRLTNAQLVRDLRRKVTTVSGEENGLMPPWLWISRPFAAAWTTWGGANMSQGTFNTWDPFNSNTNYQNATLWLGLHPEPPGPRDENNDGRLDARELQWGVFDVRRITCSDDPYPDGNRTVFSSTAPRLDQRDLKRAVRMFETLNSKFDLRRPLLVHDRALSGGRLFDRIDAEGRPIFRYALSVPEERRSMIEFAREIRQRLRPALRSHWPQRYPMDWSSIDDDSGIPPGELPIIERLGAAYLTAGGSVAAVQYGSYTDRFLDQLRHGLDQPTVGLLGDTSVNGMGALAWRSAWSTEAMTASLSANIATWRSRPTRMLEMGPDPTADVTLEDTWGALLTRARNGATTDPVWRFVSQPILPNHLSASDPARERRAVGFGGGTPTRRRSATDYGDQIYFDSGVAPGIANWTELAVKEPAPVQALTAVDPSKAPSQLPNNGYPLPQANFTDPSATTADVVFPGVEKHPFLVEALVAWVYPATTVDDGTNMYPARVGMKPAALTALAGNMAGTNRPAYIEDYAETGGIVKRGRYDTLLQQLYHMQRDPSQNLLPGGVDLPGSKLVAVVNGRVATEALAKASSNPFEQSSADPLGIDAKRDTLNKIRTPVIVVQVANPYSEPIRLGDYRLELFGSSYDFPDWEYDDNGNYLRDANGNLVPLYLNPASEDAPSTATVYLIANCLGNPSDAPDGGIFGGDVDGHGRMLPAKLLTTPMVDSEADLVSVAMWDPLFRRRWLDFLDLFELTEAGATPGDWPTSPLNPRAVPTSPKANALFWGARGQRQLSGIDNTTQLLPTSKLLSAMMVDPADRDPLTPDARTVADANEIAAGEGDPAVYGGSGAREMVAGGGPPGDFGRGSRMFKRRIVNLRAFRESLTADNLKRGISLHRILRDPSARTPVGRDHGVRSTALMKPVVDPLESVDMSAVNPAAPPPPPAAHALRFQMRDFDAKSDEDRRSADQKNDAPGRTDPPALQRHWFTDAAVGSVATNANNLVYTEQTLEVDRFDADSDFDHQTTVGVSPLDPDRSTVIDRSLVTGGRFWSAVARITLPPLRDLNPNPVPGGGDRLAAREMQMRVGAHDPANFISEGGAPAAVIDAATMEAWHRNEANPSLPSNPPLPLDTPPIQQYTFSEPGGDLSLFPPATCRWMLGWVRSIDLTGAVVTAGDNRLEPIVYAQPAPPTVGLPPVIRFTTLPTNVPPSTVVYRVLPPVIPGIMLGRSQLPKVVTPPGGMPDSPVDGSPSKVLADSNDYFTSWTRVARSWSKLHRSEFTTVRSNPSGPYDLATGPWRWTRQMVNEPSRGFESLAPANAAARTGFTPPDQRAPRFVFASRTEPDRTSNPRRPVRFELTDYEPNGLQLDGTGQPDSWLQLPTGVPYPYDLDTRFSTIGSSTAWSSPALADRIRRGEAVSNYGDPDYATATAEGDVFRRHLLRETSGSTTWSPRWMDPDVWNPLPDVTPANPADDVQVPVAGQEWGYSKWMEGIQDDGLPRNEWLLSPCVAPLPDFRNFSGTTLAAGSPTGTVAFPDQWPELILRKPTAFNCETVVWNGSAGQFAYAFYGDATISAPAAGSAANGPSSITGVGVNGGNWVRNPSTQFVADDWTSPYMQNSGGWSEGSFVRPFDPAGNVAAPRIYIADKGARLVDQTGQALRLRIDRFPAYSAALPPLPGSPTRTGTVAWNPGVWTFQGAWNTLDRVPHDGPLQMLQKDDDFEQLGELLDVFAWGPAYRIAQVDSNLQTAPGSTSRAKVSGKLLPTFIAQDGNGTRRPFRGCRATFSEIMTGRVPGFPVGEGPFVNRLQVDPPNFAFDSVTTTTGTNAGQTNSTAWQWGGTSGLRTPYGPSVPWAQRVFDAFTLDASGGAPRYDWSDPSTNVSLAATSPQQIDTTGYNAARWDLDRAPNRPRGALIPADCQLASVGTGFQPTRTTLAQWEQDRSPMLSGGGTTAPVRGRININTAPLEVMRALPHMSQLVYDDGGRTKNSSEQRLLDVPRPGPSIRGRNYTFDTRQGARASWFGSQAPFPSENPLVLVTDAIDIYRQNLDPSQAFTLSTASQWSPDQSRPLEPASGRLPVMPTYVDRGDPAIKSNTLLPLGWPTTAQIQPDRGTFLATRAPGNVLFNRGMRADPGFATIGELTTLARSANRDATAVPATFPLWQFNHSWNIRFAGIDPYNTDATMGSQDDSVGQGWYANWTGSGGGGSVDDYGGPSWRVREPLDARLSTDRQGVRRFIWRDDRALGTNDRLPPQFSWSVTPDSACGDSEEQNLLFKGISNLVTTRSDVFTVYFRVKTVRQDPVSGRWNGMDPDSILQDSRYVMCVDRSGVKRPTDPPRIVFFSKVDD